MQQGYKFSSLINDNDYVGNNLTVFSNVDMSGAFLEGFPVDNFSVFINSDGKLTAESGFASDSYFSNIYVDNMYEYTSDNGIHFHDPVFLTDLNVSDIHCWNLFSSDHIYTQSLRVYQDQNITGTIYSNVIDNNQNIYTPNLYTTVINPISGNHHINIANELTEYIDTNMLLSSSIETVLLSADTMNINNIVCASSLSVDVINSIHGTVYLEGTTFNSGKIGCSQITTPYVYANTVYSTSVSANSVISSSVSANVVNTKKLELSNATTNWTILGGSDAYYTNNNFQIVNNEPDSGSPIFSLNSITNEGWFGYALNCDGGINATGTVDVNGYVDVNGSVIVSSSVSAYGLKSYYSSCNTLTALSVISNSHEPESGTIIYNTKGYSADKFFGLTSANCDIFQQYTNGGNVIFRNGSTATGNNSVQINSQSGGITLTPASGKQVVVSGTLTASSVSAYGLNSYYTSCNNITTVGNVNCGGVLNQSAFADGDKIYLLGNTNAAKISHAGGWIVQHCAGSTSYPSSGQFNWYSVNAASAFGSIMNLGNTGNLSVIGNIYSSNDSSGSTLINGVINSNNSNTSSHACLHSKVGGASGGDPYVSFEIAGVNYWSCGVDNGDSDKFKICNGLNIGTNDYLVINPNSGCVNLPSTPCMSVQLSAAVANVTGDGTTWVMTCNSENFDQNSNYDTSTYKFTAPVNGRYLCTASIWTYGYNASHNVSSAQFYDGTTQYTGYNVNPNYVRDTSSYMHLSFSRIINLTAGAYLQVRLGASGSTKTVSADGGWTCCLLC